MKILVTSVSPVAPNTVLNTIPKVEPNFCHPKSLLPGPLLEHVEVPVHSKERFRAGCL